MKRIGAVKQGEEILGNETVVKVTKNKVAPPFKEAKFEILYGKGISRIGEIIDAAEANEIIVKAGSWYNYNNSSLAQGKENVRKELENNPTLLAEIEEKLKEAIAKGPVEKKKGKKSKKASKDDEEQDNDIPDIGLEFDEDMMSEESEEDNN